MGVDGYTPDAGFTGRNHLRAAVVKQMATRADHVVVLTESLKFLRQGAVPLLPVSAVARVVTDADLPEAMEQDIARAGVAVTKVQAS